MARSSRRDGGMAGRAYGKPMAASMGMTASAIGMQTGGIIGYQMEDETKPTVASSDCEGEDFMGILERICKDSNEDKHLGPLHDVVRAGDMDIGEHLLEDPGCHVDVCANHCSDMTPLTCAVSFGKVIVVSYLLAKGGDLNKQAVMGFTLQYASKRGYNGIAHLLLSRGVDVDSSEGTPLHVSATDMDICTHTIKEILCVTYEKVGAFSCLKCMMKLLVKAGADLNSTNPDTPLAIATSKGLNECVDYLLEVGADANILIKDVGLVLEESISFGCRTCIEISVKSGSPIETISNWSVEGILAYARSLQSGIMLDPANRALYSNRIFCHLKIGARDALVDANACTSLWPDWTKGYYRKGTAIMSLKNSDDDDKEIPLDFHDVKAVKEDAGASTACTGDKVSEDRKIQLKLHGGQQVAGVDYDGPSKFYTEMADTICQRCNEKKVTKFVARHGNGNNYQRKFCLSLLVISLLSFIQCGDASDYSEYCNPFAAQISGLCTGFVSSGDCCPSVISTMDMDPPSICVCPIINSSQMKVFGLTRDWLLEIYYHCNGRKTATDFTNLCEGISPTPSISNDTASENECDKCLHADSNQSSEHPWPVYSIIGIISLSILVAFGLSLLYYEYHRHKKDKYHELPLCYLDQNFDGSAGSMPDILSSEDTDTTAASEDPIPGDGNTHFINGSSFNDQCRRLFPFASPEQEVNQNDIEDISVNNDASPAGVLIDIAENAPEQVVDPANRIVNQDAVGPVSSTASSSATDAQRPPNFLQLPLLTTERALVPTDQGVENNHAIRQLGSHMELHNCSAPQASGEMQLDDMVHLSQSALAMQPECPVVLPNLIQRLPEGNSKRPWSSAFGSDNLVVRHDSSTFRKIQLSSDVSSSRAALPMSSGNLEIVLYDESLALEQLARQNSEPSNLEILLYERSFALEQLARQDSELPSHQLPSMSAMELEIDIGSVQSQYLSDTNQRRTIARNTRRAAASMVADELRRSPRLNKTKLRRSPRLNKSNHQ